MHPPSEPPAAVPPAVARPAETPPTDARAAAPPPPAEPRQRWRLVFRRDAVPPDQVGRATIDAWQEALEASGLPLAQLDAAGRPRVAFGAPLPAAAEGEAELAEIFLAERLPVWRLRECLVPCLPAGHAFISAEDVWLGAPPLPGRVVAAEWRVEVEPPGADLAELEAAARRLLAATSLPRTRTRAGGDKAYDLRPLLDDIGLAAPVDGGPAFILIRTRFRPELGSGRPEEVVAALVEASGSDLVVRRIVRQRLVLAGDEPTAAPA